MKSRLLRLTVPRKPVSLWEEKRTDNKCPENRGEEAIVTALNQASLDKRKNINK